MYHPNNIILSYNLKKNEISVIKISFEKNSTSKLSFNIETARFPSPNVSSTFELWYTWAHIVKQKFSNKWRRYWSLYENGTLEIQTTAKINLTPLLPLSLPDTRPRTIVTRVSDGRKVEDRCLTREKSFFWEITAAFRSSNLLPENR